MEYRKLIDVEFREFDREALEKSWKWLNDPQLKSLTMTPDFDQESQEKWFESLKTRTDYYLKAGWYNGVPIAVHGLKHITGTDGEVVGQDGRHTDDAGYYRLRKIPQPGIPVLHHPEREQEDLQVV